LMYSLLFVGKTNSSDSLLGGMHTQPGQVILQPQWKI
jgi:hypothetical protein